MKDWINANPELKARQEALHTFIVKVCDSPLRVGALSILVKSLLATGGYQVPGKPKVSEVGTYLAQKIPDSALPTETLQLLKPVKTRWGSSIMEAARANRFGQSLPMLIAARAEEFDEYARMGFSWLKPFLRMTAAPLELTVRLQVPDCHLSPWLGAQDMYFQQEKHPTLSSACFEIRRLFAMMKHWLDVEPKTTQYLQKEENKEEYEVLLSRIL